MSPWNADYPGELPILVYDDECGFCTWWTEYVARRTELDVVGFSELTPGLRDLLPEDYERSSHLVTDEGVYSLGESMEEALLRTDAGSRLRDPVEFLRAFEDYVWLRETVYALVTEHRGLLGRLFSREPPAQVEPRG